MVSLRDKRCWTIPDAMPAVSTAGRLDLALRVYRGTSGSLVLRKLLFFRSTTPLEEMVWTTMHF